MIRSLISCRGSNFQYGNAQRAVIQVKPILIAFAGNDLSRPNNALKRRAKKPQSAAKTYPAWIQPEMAASSDFSAILAQALHNI